MMTARRWMSLAFLLLIVAACGRGREAEPTPTTAAPATSVAAPANDAPAAATEAPAAPEVPQAAAPSGDAQEVVVNAMAAQMAGGPYRAMTTIDADGTITEMTAEVIPPDKMHIVISGGTLEMIMVDGTAWSKSGDTAWAQMGSPEMMQGIFDSVRGQVDGSTFSNVQLVGSEPVYGVATDVYSFTSSIGEGAEAVTSEVKLWINNATGLPVRMESTSVANGVSTHTVQNIEYDNAITIEAPTP